jgi:hypothetical protein
MLAASANNLQLNMLMLEDDSATPVRHILTLKTRNADPGDPDADPVEDPFVRITAEKVLPTGSDPFTPTKVYPIGNLGDYQCNSETDLTNILNEVAAHPTLAEVTVGPVFDIPAEDQQTYEAGYTMGWSYQLLCAASVIAGS